ncbi:hypothetical protein KAZ01_02045 [Candidatus Gracilibacteria bacterium]|nr:hypothetical protein [Candidatus Gracilibacteria bacterium]
MNNIITTGKGGDGKIEKPGGIKELIADFHIGKQMPSVEKARQFRNIVKKLENYGDEEIRMFFEGTGLIGDLYDLIKLEKTPNSINLFLKQAELRKSLEDMNELIEYSFSGTGGKDYSSLLETLKSEEIETIIKYNTFVFEKQNIDIINKTDYNDSANWVELIENEYKMIKNSGEKEKISLLRCRKNEESGVKRWYIFKNQMIISADSIYSYFSAIINSPKKDDSWKKESIYALDLNLLAYTSTKYPDLLFYCKRQFPEIAKNIEAVLEKGNYKIDSESLHLDVIEKIKDGVKNATTQTPKKSEKSIQDENKLLAILRSVGINGPYTEGDLELAEDILKSNQELNNALQFGVNEDNIDLTSGVVIDDK